MTIGDVALVSLRDRAPHVLDCHLARALADVAPALRALGVRSLQFRTLHKLRNVRRGGKKTRILSRHAVGLAVDVFAVGFDAGATLRVEHDWRGHGRKLAQVADVFAASAAFRTPLTPAATTTRIPRPTSRPADPSHPIAENDPDIKRH